MTLKPPASPERQAQLVAELRRDRDLRQQSYRERALKLLPHICGRCSREFEGQRLRELTVHHRDHNFRNNPPDGSNWELLCIYCHDDEHEKEKKGGYTASPLSAAPVLSRQPSLANPFAALDQLVKPRNDAV